MADRTKVDAVSRNIVDKNPVAPMLRGLFQIFDIYLHSSFAVRKGD
jgi:hypothetical protein